MGIDSPANLHPARKPLSWWSNTGQQEATHAHLTALGLPREAADDDTTLYFHDVPPQVRDQALRRGEPEQS